MTIFRGNSTSLIKVERITTSLQCVYLYYSKLTVITPYYADEMIGIIHEDRYSVTHGLIILLIRSLVPGLDQEHESLYLFLICFLFCQT